MGLTRVWVFRCDVRNCLEYLEIDRDCQVWSVRLHARELGWKSPGPAAATWFCPRHAYVSDALRERLTRDHEDWCPVRTRYGPCCCRAAKHMPHIADEAVGYALWRSGKDCERRIQVVRVDARLGEIL